MKKRLLSGVKPTGQIHIGNYFGAIKQFVELQNDYECFIFIPDYHALNQVHNKEELSSLILETAKTYLAAGLNPKETVIYRQSDVPIVTELTWIFNAITSMPILQRAHAYKDALAKSKTINVGTFDYPVLMAADILMYDADIVPVGQDQKQHVEIAREIAGQFNKTFGETFKLPEAKINESVAVIKGLDGRKMSKSYNNVIGLFDDRETLKKKVMSIVTDSRKPEEPKDPETCNIFALHKLFSQSILSELESRYKEGKISYKESKEILLENIDNYLAPMREKKKELDENPEIVLKALETGKEKAEEIALAKMKEVREKIGIDFEI